MEWDEPIPEFGSRFPHALESCLGVPFQTFHRKDLYPGLVKKAAILFYLMIKNHPFENGNKRIAVMTLFWFLYKNGRWLIVDNQSLYEFAKKIARGEAERKNDYIQIIEGFLSAGIIRIGKD